MKLLLPIVTLLLAFTSCQNKHNDTEKLRQKIEQIVSGKKATVGVSILGQQEHDIISFHGNQPFPMQSVFKMHIALAVLAAIDQGQLSLDQKIMVDKSVLLPQGNWSPLRDEHPNGGSFTVGRLIQYAVAQSDNLACDVLIRLIGTPKTVETYFKKNKLEALAITYNEKDMQAKWENMFLNWTTPKTASETLKIFYENKNNLLSQASYAFFWKTMKETSTGPNRLKGLLPEATVVAHKTGSSGTNDQDLTPATNDIGIVFLPDGKYFIISIFVSDSMETADTNERIIAEIAKVTYEHFTARQ